jgi:hypothetical protein
MMLSPSSPNDKCLVACGTLQTMKKCNFPYGRMVPVFDGQMHITEVGEGKHTMGVALPSADFMPLQRALAKDYNTIVVEYFGVVFSTSTAYYRRNPCLCLCLAPPRKDSATPWFDQIVHSSDFIRDTMSLPYL